MLPIFIELRRINSGESLLEHINKYFEILGLNINISTFKLLLSQGKIAIMLDAFDEVNEDNKQKLLNEIEYLSSFSSSCFFVITTRPDSGIEMSTFFTVCTLDNLKGDEFKKVIRKLSDSLKYSQRLIKHLENSDIDAEELLSTPLLVTLLIISYKSYQEIPTRLSDYFETIFQVLLQRHDGVKPAYTRQRRCKLNDSEYRKVFDALCFESSKHRSSIFNFDDIIGFTDTILEKFRMHESSDNYINDIVRITCLLLKDGNQYRYIHNSVMEYYSASFIRSRPDSLAEQFYNKCIESKGIHPWKQELHFLEDIDRYRYYKYYLLPLCLNILSLKDKLTKSPPKISKSRLKKMFSDVKLGFVLNTKWETDLGMLSHGYQYNRNFVWEMIKLDYNNVIKAIKDSKIPIIDTRPKKHSKPKDQISLISLVDVIDQNILIKELSLIGQKHINHYYNLGRKADTFITQQNEYKLDFDFLS